ncbi:acyltransferase family protein [Microbacterium sp. NC79]|uniref:acyltransferase family protein n=1 Tax=Microbacterium sp. NC79 TaxID=2851009 RepID=UPI00349F64BB
MTAFSQMSSKKTRDPFWDNARFICIALVVAGHALQPMSRVSDVAYAVYLVIYTFHMPAFAIMSGYFTKSGAPTRTSLKRVITDLVVPYLIFETIWSLLSFAISGKLNLNYASVSWTLWFLLALAVFRVIIPYLALLRWPVSISIVMSVAAGYIPAIDSTFAMDRIIALMPFFVIGWALKDRGILKRADFFAPRHPAVVVAATALIASALTFALILAAPLRTDNMQRWFFFRESYVDLSLPDNIDPPIWGGLVRLGIIAIALIMCWAFFTLAPRREYRWTKLGAYTLYVYLLHTFVLFPVREGKLPGQSHTITAGLQPDWLWVILLIAGSIGVAFLLSSKPVRTLTRPLVEPRVTWLFKERSEERSA